MDDAVAARWLSIAIVFLTLVIPGALVCGAAARWGRRGAWIGLGLGDLFGSVCLYGLIWMAMRCRHDCYEAPDRFTRVWMEDIAGGLFQWGKVFVMLTPFHLIWGVIGAACAFIGLRRRRRRQAIVRAREAQVERSDAGSGLWTK
jgi:hypothetical protein